MDWDASRGLGDPVGQHHLGAVPLPVVQEQEPEAGQVLARRVQAGERGGAAGAVPVICESAMPIGPSRRAWAKAAVPWPVVLRSVEVLDGGVV